MITASEQGNVVMKDGRKKVLTVKAKCEAKTRLPCFFLTELAGGIPTNCQLSQVEWIMPHGKIKCNGNMVLTEKSSINCIHGGVIRPLASDCITGIGIASGIPDIPFYNTDVDSKNGSEKEIETSKNQSITDANKEQEILQNEGEMETNESAYASHSLCDYENCEERETCKYYKSQIFVENESSLLKSNFINNRSDEWKKYFELHKRKNLESQNGGWRIAAHHIISGNQVLMMRDDSGNLLYGEIVKLANYFGYDINNEWNCIMLPTNENGFGELEQITKYAIPYDVMWMMGRQWHVGGHEYRLDKDTIHNLTEHYQRNLNQYPTPGYPNFFVNYKEAMKEEMNLLMMKYSRPRCWKKNYESRKKSFFDDMNSLSKKVERYLLAFGNNPRKSFPFFVSRISVEYAYDLPATSKLIVIYRKQNQIRAKKIRLERYMKNGLKIVPIEKEDIMIQDKMSFIRFCENVMHFYIDILLTDFELPFSKKSLESLARRKVNFEGLDIMKYLCSNSSEIMAFISQNEFIYQPIAKVVSERGGNI